MKAYNSGQDYLMSEGNSAFESAVKGMINRARSAVGTGAEDFAYFLNDNFPGYKPDDGGTYSKNSYEDDWRVLMRGSVK